MKLIKINTPYGQYTLPLKDVAEHRAKSLYSEKNDKEGYDLAIEFIMEYDNYNGILYLKNYTEFEEWKDKITKISDDVIEDNEEDIYFWFDINNFEIV